MDITTSYQHIAKIAATEASKTRWLIESLWLSEAVGLIGGPPKSCKSWLAIDMAVSIASATNCLGHFPVLSPGPALIYLAEDNVLEVKERVTGICESRSLSLNDINLYTITVPSLRLDEIKDQTLLRSIIEQVKPRLVVLDPLVRLHRQDENNAKEMSALLSYFRELQRSYGCGVLLVHHATKRSHERAGLNLRGSSDLHAFGDSNLYLAKRRDWLDLTIEHRSAAALEPLVLQLASDNTPAHLVVTNPPKEITAIPLSEEILNKLKAAGKPLTRQSLRDLTAVNNQRLGDTLQELESQQKIQHHSNGWQII